MKIAVLVSSALLAIATPALAREPERIPGTESEQRYEELAQWLKDYDAWEKWFEKWGNRVAHSSFSDQMTLDRKERPAPPLWLAARCESDVEGEVLLERGCGILRQWDDHPELILQRRRYALAPSTRQADEKDLKSMFLQRVHVTGLWTQAQYPSSHAYGIIGMQVGVVETGRFTLPAIGVMLVMVPDGEGGHEWKPATTIGFGFRLCDFVAPFVGKQASLHFNIARTSVHGVQDERFLPGVATVNLVGLSVSPAKRR
jgi:hypothetical protein